MDGLKQKFLNPLQKPLDRMTEQLHKFTDDNFAGFKKALPDFFNNTDSNVVAARDGLMSLIGNAQTASNQKFLGIPIRDLAQLGDTLYDAATTFQNHTNEISGVGPEDKSISVQPIFGNVIISGATVNVASSNVLTANLSKSVYPVVNIGDTVVVNSQELTVTGKQYASVAGGTVSVDTATNNVVITTSSVVGMNLAAISLRPGMYINVNSEIRQVNTINTYGDYLTVYNAFRNSAAAKTLYTENKIIVNTAVATTASDLTIAVQTGFVANSLCLDNVITGNGTNFTSIINVDDKIYYDDKEFFVTAVTDTTITVDDSVRFLEAVPVYKVISEFPLFGVTEGNKPDDILSHFATIDQLTSSMGGNLTKDLTTKYMTSKGNYEVIPTAKPTDTVKSLQNSYLVTRMTSSVQGIIDQFHGDMIRSLTNVEIVQLIQEKRAEIESIRDDLLDSVKRDLAAIAAVKGLLAGLLKLFIISCSKKKAKDGDTSSDEYLQLILVPDPRTQGCLAIESDMIDIFDEADREFNDPGLPADQFVPYTDTGLNELESLLEGDDEIAGFADEVPTDGTGVGDIGIDEDPELPAPVVDPCTQPC